jgi:hypothetical protein
MVEKPNTLQRTSITVLLAAVITLAAIPTFFNPVEAQTVDSSVRVPPPGALGTLVCDRPPHSQM